MRAYAPNSPNCERWFALEHNEERHGDVHIDHAVPQPPPKIWLEEEVAEAAYQAALEAALQRAL